MLMNLPTAFYLTLALVLVGGETVSVRRPSSSKGKPRFVSTTPSSNSAAAEESGGVKCVCDGGCEHLRGIDCPFGLTFDMCRCCLVCARGEGEVCGGALGNCAVGQHCKSDPFVKSNNSTDPAEGRCSRDEGGCGGHVEIRFGCVIGPEGNCICSSRAGCPGEDMFLFETEEQCRSRMAYLIAKKDLEVSELRTTSATGNLFNPSFTPSTIDDCAKVQCPTIQEEVMSIPCPADSYRLPTMVDHHLLHLDNKEDLSAERRCCPEKPLAHEKCQCIPGLHCSLPPDCPSGFSPKITQNSTKEPGRCCPKFQCMPDTKEVEEVQNGCKYDGETYSSGETWSNREDCSECTCHNGGVVSCKPIKCDIPQGCPLARTPSNSCCPVCVGCVTASGGVYNNSETWEEDPCTSCTCHEGRVQCHAAMCHPGDSTCPHPIHVPGECCPRCDLNGDGVNKDPSCPFLDCHRKECPKGFSLDRLGCPTCRCSTSNSKSTTIPSNSPCPVDMANCDLHCPFGYQVENEGQCSICKCRSGTTDLNSAEHDNNHDDDDNEVSNENNSHMLSPTSTTMEKKQCHVSAGLPRFEGEEWSDQCRRCICKNGFEMCTLITCHPPSCEHPIFFSGDCCPRCPDESQQHQLGHVNFSISVCQSSDGTERLEGESWALGCLHCTCHYGQVLCAAPECPPTPCPSPRPASPTTQQCCPSCPPSTTNSNQNTVTTKNNYSSSEGTNNCLSDDSLKSYDHGETWKVGACQSCICEGGEIQCFSMGKCSPLGCDRPVLAKNQCCPICLDDHRRISSPEVHSRGMEPLCAILIGVVLGLSLVLGVVLFRHCLCRRVCASSSRLIKIKKAPPSFHSSNSSQDTPPVTPDCCYKCDYNKYSSCAQLSEQKVPLFNPNSSSASTSSSSGGGSGSGAGGGAHNSDKV